MELLALDPITRPFDLTMTPPGSKSLTNRALVLAALSIGNRMLDNVLFADDTRVMLQCLSQLGIGVDVDETARSVRVSGAGGVIPANSAVLFCGNSGTTIRFLSALCTLGKGTFTLDGIPRMRQRPIAELGQLLKNLGGRVRYPMTDGYPPVEIIADGLPGGLAPFGSAQSSQFLSAVLQVAPYARHEVQIALEGRQTSWPYVSMTMRLMDEFGVTPEVMRDISGEPRRIIVPRGTYAASHYAIEPDASNASYFLAAAALHPGSRLVVRGLGRRSLQGDVGFADVLRRMGAEVRVGESEIEVRGPETLFGIDVDLSTMPDTAQTLAVVALFAEESTTLRGIQTLRVKETDRVAALVTELTKLGASVELDGDDMTIHPPGRITPAAIDTYDDHRMAMSFALAGTRVAGIVINDPRCVNKTYPDFFADLGRLSPSELNTNA